MSTLIIALPPSGGDTTTRYEHVLTPDGATVGVHATGAASLLPLASRGTDEIVAVVPAELMSWHRVELPKGVGSGSSRLRPVLNSLLEDRLLDDPQDLHLACEPAFAAGSSIWVCAVDKAWLRQHLQVLETAGRPVARLVPEFAPQGGALRLQVLGEAEHPIIVMTGDAVAGGVARFPLDAGTMGAILGHDNPSAPAELLAEPATAERAETLFQRRVEIRQRERRLMLATQTPWDLAQFDLANTSRTRSLKRTLGAAQTLLRAPEWRAARWGFGLLLAANLVGLNAWAWKEQASWQSRRQAIDATLTRTFPSVTVVVDAPLQMAREVTALRQATGTPSGRDLEAMLAAAGAALPPGKNLSALEFAAGEIRLKGLNLGPEELTALAEKLQPMGYTSRMDGDSLLIRSEGTP